MSIFGYDRGASLSVDQFNSLGTYADGKFKNFVIRYLAGPDSWKYFSNDEAQNALNAGYLLGSVFEDGGEMVKGGYDAGVSAATVAKSRSETLSQPKGKPIFFAVDYDAPESDYDTIEAFFKGVKDVFGDDSYKVGIYAHYYLIEEMFSRGACDYYWQTIAWSDDKLSEHADLYQYKVDVQVNGINVDLNECYNSDIFWGQETPVDPPVIQTLEMYDDVPVTHWAAESIKKAYEKNVMTGVADRIFGLNQEVKREQVAVVLDKIGLLNKQVKVLSTPFTDVPSDHWAAASIKRAFESGAMDGVADNVFGLGQSLTREQFAQLLDNLGLLTVGPTYWKINDIYKDVPSDFWAVNAIENAYLKGVIIGVSEHTFGLGEAVMREQLAKVFDNIGKLD